MEKSLQLQIYGRVQGVSFRYYTQRKACELGLRGFVKNMPDGSVYVEATGDDDQMDRFVEYCRQGPPLARVDEIKTENIHPVKEEMFFVK